jgi:hypothetical protein
LSSGPEQVLELELSFELSEESDDELGLLDPLEPPESPPPELLDPPAWATLNVVSAGAA